MIARLGRDHHDRRARDRRWNPGARPSDFASVYPANRAARVARVLHVPGGAAVVVHEEEQVLMAIALRNVGAGLAVLRGWHLRRACVSANQPHADPTEVRRLSRDLCVAVGSHRTLGGPAG